MVKGEISVARDFLTAGFDFFADLKLCKINLLGDAFVLWWALKGINAKVILDQACPPHKSRLADLACQNEFWKVLRSVSNLLEVHAW